MSDSGVDPAADEGGAMAPGPGSGLCLSGGGYRAMLFHAGALWRLNEAALLGRLDRVSSVSGGSITAGVLGLAWPRLDFDGAGVARALVPEVVEPLRRMARHTIDFPAIALGLLLPGTIGDRIVGSYRRRLFGSATLQDLPDRPRFVFDATNLQSGVLWRFAKPYMRDYRVGEVKAPRVGLATAVAASSAFPPFLSPIVLKLADGDFTPGSGNDLQRSPFTTRVSLTDGGVYDNLGLEPIWKRYETILISDGGGHMGAQERPHRFWPLHAYRVLGVIDTQVRSLRKRAAIDAFVAGRRKGGYWGIRTDIADYGLPSALPCPHAATMKLASVATRLGRMDETTQERLINWGYAVCDATLRRHVDPGLPAPAGFPYPRTGVEGGA
jgi:NTE family protein